MKRLTRGLRKLLRYHAHISKGQAIAEFVLIVPIMLLLMLVAIDFGRVFASYVQLTNSAREAAAYAAGNPTDLAGIQAHGGYEQNSQAQGGQGVLTITRTCANSSGGALDCALTPGGGGTGNTITVHARERFTFLTPIIGDLFGGGITLDTSTTAAVLSLAASGGNGSNACGTTPHAGFTATVNGNTVTLDASASTPQTGDCAISGYNWDMGDGANPYPPVVDRTTTYMYAANGTYTILLQVTSPGGTDQATQTVTIGPSPTATPTPTPTATPAPSSGGSPPPTCNTVPTFTSAFTGNGNGQKQHQMTFYGGYSGQPAPVTWSWTYGDGGTGSGQNDSNNYNDTGTFTVTLTVHNGTCNKSVSHSVSVP